MVQANGSFHERASRLCISEIVIAVKASDTGTPQLLRDLVHTEDGTVNIVVPGLQGIEGGLIAVKPAVEDLHA